MSLRSGIITLTTDFGTKDEYVGSIKGVILSIFNNVKIIDISHHIKPHDIISASFILGHSAFHFPLNTIHVAVVDPGVGSMRKNIAVYVDGHYFVGPDNGIFTHVTHERNYKAVSLTNQKYWRSCKTSSTFHGRDIFSSVAAYLAKGVSLRQLGVPIEKIVQQNTMYPIKVTKTFIEGEVIHIDHFGNVTTNLSYAMLCKYGDLKRLKIKINNVTIMGISHTYTSVSIDMPVAYINSNSALELAVNGGSFEHTYHIKRNMKVVVYNHIL